MKTAQPTLASHQVDTTLAIESSQTHYEKPTCLYATEIQSLNPAEPYPLNSLRTTPVCPPHAPKVATPIASPIVRPRIINMTTERAKSMDDQSLKPASDLVSASTRSSSLPQTSTAGILHNSGNVVSANRTTMEELAGKSSQPGIYTSPRSSNATTITDCNIIDETPISALGPDTSSNFPGTVPSTDVLTTPLQRELDQPTIYFSSGASNISTIEKAQKPLTGTATSDTSTTILEVMGSEYAKNMTPFARTLSQSATYVSPYPTGATESAYSKAGNITGITKNDQPTTHVSPYPSISTKSTSSKAGNLPGMTKNDQPTVHASRPASPAPKNLLWSTPAYTEPPAPQRSKKPWNCHQLACFAQNLEDNFPFQEFAAEHHKTLLEVYDVFSAVVQMPLLQFSARGRSRAGLKEFAATMREFREMEREASGGGPEGKGSKRPASAAEEGDEIQKKKRKA
ncbi:hypothetical protein MMC12_001814 [Toensbergia leucococca]|nr:hypothetical protein [Toensbergia leucococca]